MGVTIMPFDIQNYAKKKKPKRVSTHTDYTVSSHTVTFGMPPMKHSLQHGFEWITLKYEIVESCASSCKF